MPLPSNASSNEWLRRIVYGVQNGGVSGLVASDYNGDLLSQWLYAILHGGAKGSYPNSQSTNNQLLRKIAWAYTHGNTDGLQQSGADDEMYRRILYALQNGGATGIYTVQAGINQLLRLIATQLITP